MRFLRRFLARLKNFATGGQDDKRLREEMEEHLARQTEENQRAGMNAEEARRQAVMKFGGVGGIAENIRFHRGQPALGVAADGVGHGERVALGMDADRFLAGERDPHRPPGQARQHRRLRLDRHVLLAAERAAVRREFDEQPLFRLAEDGGDLPAILEDALGPGYRCADGRRAAGGRGTPPARGTDARCAASSICR